MNAEQPASIVLLHGFAQTGRCLGPLAGGLAGPDRVHAPDLPGHGDGGDVDGDLWWGAERLAGELIRLPRPLQVVGYSLGGRLALHLAIAHPTVVDQLVLIGATAGIEDAEERAARRHEDEARAAHLEEVGVASFLEEWLALPLFAALPEWAAFRTERRRNTAEGLAASLRRWGTGTQDPLWERLGRIVAPTLVLAGARDTKFAALGRRLAEGIPHATFEEVPDAGHAAHLEQPAATLAAIRRGAVRPGTAPGPR